MFHSARLAAVRYSRCPVQCPLRDVQGWGGTRVKRAGGGDLQPPTPTLPPPPRSGAELLRGALGEGGVTCGESPPH